MSWEGWVKRLKSPISATHFTALSNASPRRHINAWTSGRRLHVATRRGDGHGDGLGMDIQADIFDALSPG